MSVHNFDIEEIFSGPGAVFEAASLAFSVLFEGAGVTKVFSRARHLLTDEHGVSPEEAANIVHLVKNSVFDPMASGDRPERDPDVKRQIASLPGVVDYVFSNIVSPAGGLNDKARRRTARLGEAVREYLAGHPGTPLDASVLSTLDRPASGTGNAPATAGYVAIPVASSDELVKKLDEIGAGDVEWCIRSPGPWDTYSDGGKSRFYILRDASRPDSDPRSVVGMFVTAGNRVANSFDRANRPVKFSDASGLLRSAGIETADSGDLAAALGEGVYDLADIVDEYREIAHNMFLVKNYDNDGVNVIVYSKGRYRPIIRGWADGNSFSVVYDGRVPRHAIAGRGLYSLQEPYGFLGMVPDGLAIEPEYAVDDAPVLFVRRGDRRVNLLDADSMKLVLAEGSDVQFDSAAFCGAWEGMSGRRLEFASADFGDGSYWVLCRDPQEGPSSYYTVTAPGQDLGKRPCITVPDGFAVRDISANGRYYVLRKTDCLAGDPDRDRDYLMGDGKKLLPDTAYRHVDFNNWNRTWTAYNGGFGSHEPYYLLHCDTGKIERVKD